MIRRPGYGPRRTEPDRGSAQGGNLLRRFSGIGQIASALRSYFTPASLAVAPGAAGLPEGRTVMHTTATLQHTAQALVSGQLTWVFDTPFPQGVAPVITHTPEGAPASGTPVIYIVKGSLTHKSVGLASTDTNDTRKLHLAAGLPPL
jgi:hypothetical protein